MKFESVRVGEEFALILNGVCGSYLKLSPTEAVEIKNPHKRGQHIRIGSVAGISETAPIAECAYCDRPLLGGGHGFFALEMFAYHRACRLVDRGYGPRDMTARPGEPDRDGRGEQSEQHGEYPGASAAV